MAIDPEKLLSWPFAEVEQSYSVKDAILYALGIGVGYDPKDRSQLPFLFEEADFQVFPTMAAVLAWPGFWLRDPATGVDWRKVLHGEQGLRIHKPLPPSATVKARTKVTRVLDKGAGKGALIYFDRLIIDQANGEALATASATAFARGDGGFGGASGPQPSPHVLPERAPDSVCDLPTNTNAAQLYRLSGDPNPLHIDPAIALGAGFKAPILHGLCTFGVAAHAILRCYCDYDVNRFHGLQVRFSAPVYPGETIRTEMWRDGKAVAFRSSVVERNIVVLDNGHADVSF